MANTFKMHIFVIALKTIPFDEQVHEEEYIQVTCTLLLMYPIHIPLQFTILF